MARNVKLFRAISVFACRRLGLAALMVYAAF